MTNNGATNGLGGIGRGAEAGLEEPKPGRREATDRYRKVLGVTDCPPGLRARSARIPNRLMLVGLLNRLSNNDAARFTSTSSGTNRARARQTVGEREGKDREESTDKVEKRAKGEGSSKTAGYADWLLRRSSR